MNIHFCICVQEAKMEAVKTICLSFGATWNPTGTPGEVGFDYILIQFSSYCADRQISWSYLGTFVTWKSFVGVILQFVKLRGATENNSDLHVSSAICET